MNVAGEVRAVRARRVQAGHDSALRDVVEALWADKVHELRSVAIAVLERLGVR